MSIFDLFSSGKPENQPAPAATPNPQTPANPGNLPEGSGSGNPGSKTADANGVVPPNALDGDKSGENNSNSPLDQFKDLWEPIKNEEGKSAPPALDPKKLQETIGKVDFSKVIPAENLQKITAGGEDAVAAFAQSMNAVAQQVMLQSTLASNKLIENAVSAAIDQQTKNLPKLVKDQNLSESLNSANPLFSNPAVKPIIEAVKSQLSAKYPNASTAELTTMAQNYVTVMGESFAPKVAEPQAKGSNTIDWDVLMGTDF